MSTTYDQPNLTANSPRIDKKLLWSDDLCTFIESLDSYLPTIPEAVVKYNLQKGLSYINATLHKSCYPYVKHYPLFNLYNVVNFLLCILYH